MGNIYISQTDLPNIHLFVIVTHKLFSSKLRIEEASNSGIKIQPLKQPP
jgi:hypothetical protein